MVFRFLCQLDVTTASLDEGRHSILNLELGPLVVVQVEHQHFVHQSTVFLLSAIDQHAFAVHYSDMIFPGDSSKAFGSKHR